MKEYNGDGYDCTCRAQCESECCCGADWTDSEIYELRDEIAKLKALNGELTSALRLICAADNMTEAKIAVIQANTLLQSEAAKP